MVSVRNFWGPLFLETGLRKHTIQKPQIYTIKVGKVHIL